MAAHWTEQHYSDLFAATPDASRLVLMAETDSEVGERLIGFLVARHIAPEWELENIVVASENRGKGIGRQLMQALLDRAKQANSQRVFLEVRESNSAARRLYEKVGFEEIGRRKSYYFNPIEDAILYRKVLL